MTAYSTNGSYSDRTIENYPQRPPDRAKHYSEDEFGYLTAFASLATISWLGFIVHHLDTTATEQSIVIVSIRCTLTTSPAELILAKSARHMVAARTLLYPCTTHWTERHIVFVFFSPAL